MIDDQMPFLAALPPAIFAGREALLAKLRGSLLAANPPRGIVLGFLPGVGKTALAAQIVQEKEIQSHYTGGVLWAALGQKPNQEALLGEWLMALGFELGRVAKMKSIPERSAAIREKIGQERMLLVLDDVWEATDAQPFLNGGLNSVYIVTTRRRQVVRDLKGAEMVEVKELDHKAGLEVLRSLAPEAVEAEPELAGQLVSAVGGLPLALILMGKHLWLNTSDGPRDFIRMVLEDLQDAEQRLKLETDVSPYFRSSSLEDAPLSLIASIQISDLALDNGARHALRRLSNSCMKPPRFSLQFARDAELASDSEIALLFQAGLIEKDREYDRREQDEWGFSGPVNVDRVMHADSVKQELLFRIPQTIADYAQISGLPDSGQPEEIHRRAADYYKGWLRNFEETHPDPQPFLRQFRYVHPRWLQAMTNFLCHLASIDPIYANLQLARLYFDAFWWWGCYITFPFCDKLLEEWQGNQTSTEDQRWISLIRTFHKAYPTGADKHGKGDWLVVDWALNELLTLGGMKGDVDVLDKDRLHIRGLIDVFLAESWRYRETSDSQDENDSVADAYYTEALAIFLPGANTNDDDAWNVPWLLWHQGDLAMERGQGELALTSVGDSRRRAIEASENACDWDHEIIANDFRVEGDVFWKLGNAEEAFYRYASALMHAYLFLGCPISANFYTVAFYQEITGRTLMRLQELWAANRQEEALSACSVLHDFWEPFWQETGTNLQKVASGALLSAGKLDDLAAYLFPPLPTEADMMMQGEDTVYTTRIRKLAELVQQGLFPGSGWVHATA